MKRSLKQLAQLAYYTKTPSICMDIQAWAKQKGLQTFELAAPVYEELLPYVSQDESARQDFEANRNSLHLPQVMIQIEKAIVRDSLGLVELPDKQICFQGNWHLPYLQQHPSYKRLFAYRNRRLSGDIFSLLCLWGSEYYHWLHDVLPRLEMALPFLPSGTRFLIQENPRPYQLDCLQAYGITSDMLIPQPVTIDSEVERLWFATPAGHTGLGSTTALNKVAERLKSFFCTDSATNAPKSIYVSRRKATCRRIINEDELELLLQTYGFTVINSEDLKFAEQVKTFSQAQIILGPHGAGLVNLIFAPENSTICEITPASVPCYLILAKQLGKRFHRIPADSIETDNRHDMHVDVENVKTTLNKLIS